MGHIIYALSLVICAIWLGGGLTHCVNYHSYWSRVPFGLGPAALPALAGCSVFPIINSLVAIGCLAHAAWYYKTHKEL